MDKTLQRIMGELEAYIGLPAVEWQKEHIIKTYGKLGQVMSEIQELDTDWVINEGA